MDPLEGQLSPEDQAVIEEFDKQLGITGQSDEPQLILGKFKSQEDLITAYQNLERKLGSSNQQTTPKNSSQEPVTAKPEQKLELGVEPEKPEVNKPTRPLSEYLQEMGQGEGVTDEMRQELKDTYNLDDGTIDLMDATARQSYRASVEEIVREAGGQEALDRLSDWVGKTYTPAQIAEINQALKNDLLRGPLIRDLSSKMKSSYNAPAQRGQEPTNLGVATTQGFATDSEMQTAMADQRYTNPQHPEHARYVDEVHTRFANSPHLH